MDNVAFGGFSAGTMSVRIAPDRSQAQQAGVRFRGAGLALGGYAGPAPLYAGRARYVDTGTAKIALRGALARGGPLCVSKARICMMRSGALQPARGRSGGGP
jgi:hypothetical protein